MALRIEPELRMKHRLNTEAERLALESVFHLCFIRGWLPSP